ncbi:ABC transporter ATP-binding protein [Aggregicoccus sp. 17bor-14]|uniref:ABC transporter ATP-binding protein n=1 Tax=Myxococcaceae TaxID=31 RepID=UPI00129CE542|nr:MULTISPECIES: ABC transporter ATP-binding protein [Myxococcaceae]MBF5043405.1 ABC transporter ATP-binding protein [Simulacricoccus sp. 17bor-14]MRI89163.1 ABC transporter ATP-binding protein [Aggregicoccus sp. 17bor-14]
MSSAPVTPALEISGLSKRYGKFTALQDLSLTIAPGEIFALLGPNGAGKTTMIGSVCGLVKKTTGTIRVFGHDLDQDPVRPRYEVGLVPQEINFDPFFTVKESLQIQLGYYGRPRDDARVTEVLTALNLQSKADAITRQLSGGMKRRLLISKALVHRPRLVFLDEPTAGVDVELRRDLWTYVRKLASEGTTIVLTTHYLEEAEELADRVGVINEGRLLLVEEKTALLRRMGEKRLVVQLSSALPTLPEAAARVGATLAPDGRTLTYVERSGGAPAGELLRALYAAGVPVADVETRHSRLEDVMLEVLRGRPAA